MEFLQGFLLAALCIWTGIGVGIFFLPIILRHQRRAKILAVTWAPKGSEGHGPFMVLRGHSIYAYSISACSSADAIVAIAACARMYAWREGKELHFPYEMGQEVNPAGDVSLRISTMDETFWDEYVKTLDEHTSMKPHEIVVLDHMKRVREDGS